MPAPWFLFFLGFALALALVWVRMRFFSFPAQTSDDYTNGPQFDLRTHLNGPMRCDGAIYGPTGRVVSRFSADMTPRWEGNKGVMPEVFRYDSGTVQHREWQLNVDDAGRITASAEDLVGQGTGQQLGSAVVMRYRIRLTADAGGHQLSVTDWMYLAPDGTIVNRSQFRKFGIKVAELVAVIAPKDLK
jgi:hypothetical protein